MLFFHLADGTFCNLTLPKESSHQCSYLPLRMSVATGGFVLHKGDSVSYIKIDTQMERFGNAPDSKSHSLGMCVVSATLSHHNLNTSLEEVATAT